MTPTKRSVAVTSLWRVCVLSLSLYYDRYAFCRCHFIMTGMCPWLIHCVKSVRIRSYSGSYSVRMRENKDQDNPEYGHFSRSDSQKLLLLQNYQNIKKWLFWVYYKRLIVFCLKDLCCFFQNINYLISFFVIC